MAYPGSDDSTRPSGSERLLRTGRLLKRVGVALVITAVPAVVITAAIGVVDGATSLPGWVGAALSTPVTTFEGVAWAFHVATLTAFIGLWLLGFALVVEGVVAVE